MSVGCYQSWRRDHLCSRDVSFAQVRPDTVGTINELADNYTFSKIDTIHRLSKEKSGQVRRPLAVSIIAEVAPLSESPIESLAPMRKPALYKEYLNCISGQSHLTLTYFHILPQTLKETVTLCFHCSYIRCSSLVSSTN